MDYRIFVITAILIFLVTVIGAAVKKNKKLRRKLEQNFGTPPQNQSDSLDSIPVYHEELKSMEASSDWIDEITWNDLELDLVYRRINACASSVGEEYLYHILHAPQFDQEKLLKREKIITYLKTHEGQRLELQVTLSGLGKQEYNGLPEMIVDPDLRQIKFAPLYPVLAAIPLVGLLLIPFFQVLGSVVLIASFMVNTIVYYRLKMKMDFAMQTMGYVASMLGCCKKICDTKDAEAASLFVEFKRHFEVFRPISGKIPILSQATFSDSGIILDYLKILFLSDIRKYNQAIKWIQKNKTTFHQLYQDLGELDVSISILSFRKSLPFFCVPEFLGKNEIRFTESYHPLISDPVCNDATVCNDWIITGSNASGKSTFIKSVAVNCILAQTIHTCAAAKFSVRPSKIFTSMAVRDHLSEGESYFITEIKSLKRILDKSLETSCFCFIDEILKGTNTVERIAASASVLQQLHGRDGLCLVASHDMELTELLKDQYDLYSFSEQITEDGIRFDYLLKPGASQTTNAIKLLSFMGFDASVVADAEHLVQQFRQTKQWQKDCLSTQASEQKNGINEGFHV